MSYVYSGMAGFFDQVTQPHVLDQALLYMAPPYWRMKKKEERRTQQRAEQAKQQEWWRQEQTRRAEEERERASRAQRMEVLKRLRRIEGDLSFFGGYINHIVGEVKRTVALYNLSPRFLEEGEQLEGAAMTVVLESPLANASMTLEELEGTEVALQRSRGLLEQLAQRAEALVRTAQAYRR